MGLTTPPVGGTVLNENFSGGIPGSWTIVDGGFGGGAAATWTTANPGGRSAAAPIASPFPIVDSAFAGVSAAQDEQLITLPLDLRSAVTVILDFDQFFNWSEFKSTFPEIVNARTLRAAPTTPWFANFDG